MKSYTAVYKRSGNWYLAWVEEIPGVNTQGKTLFEAKKNLKEALFLVLQTNKKLSGHVLANGGMREKLML